MPPSSGSAPRSFMLANEVATIQLARDFGRVLRAPAVIYLQGDLGTGKTTFARALIQGLGYSGRVKSPTYGLLETYRAGDFDFMHLDLYRIQDPGEIEYLAIADQFTDRGVLLVEWPEKAAALLPDPDILIKFSEIASGRCIECIPRSEVGRAMVSGLPAP